MPLPVKVSARSDCLIRLIQSELLQPTAIGPAAQETAYHVLVIYLASSWGVTYLVVPKLQTQIFSETLGYPETFGQK